MKDLFFSHLSYATRPYFLYFQPVSTPSSICQSITCPTTQLSSLNIDGLSSPIEEPKLTPDAILNTSSECSFNLFPTLIYLLLTPGKGHIDYRPFPSTFPIELAQCEDVDSLRMIMTTIFMTIILTEYSSNGSLTLGGERTESVDVKPVFSAERLTRNLFISPDADRSHPMFWHFMTTVQQLEETMLYSFNKSSQ